MAEQVTVDEEELKELQRPWHAAHVDVGLVKKPLERRLGAWTKDALLRAIACGTQGCRLDAWGRSVTRRLESTSGLLLTRVDGQRVGEEVVDLVNRPVEEAHLVVVPVSKWVGK